MTPLEMTDWLDSLAETDLNAGTLSAAAAMLREAERVLHLTVPAVVAWSNQYDLDEDGREQWVEIAGQIDAWLEGRTP